MTTPMQPTATGLPSQLRKTKSPFSSAKLKLKNTPYIRTYGPGSQTKTDPNQSMFLSRSLEPIQKSTDVDECLLLFF